MLKKLDKKNKDMGATKKVSVQEEIVEMVEDTIVEDTVEENDEFAGFDDSENDEPDDEIEDEDEEDSVEEDEEDEVVEEDEEEEEEEEDEDEVDEDEVDGNNGLDDLLMVINEKRKAQLEERDYIGLLIDVVAEPKPPGKYGKPWVSIGLKFRIKNPDTQEPVEVTFNANRSLDPKSRLYPIVKGIWGSEPGDNFNLRELKGKKARVSIEHSTDDEGNVWDNIVAARKYVPKKK